jgi:hypothetical protein
MAKWWKDRDRWMPRSPYLPPPRHGIDEGEPELSFEDVGDVADDDCGEFDDVERLESDRDG